MKRIEVIIRKTKFDEVRETLYEAGIEFFSYWEVRGVGKSVQARVYRGIKYDTSTIERIMMVFYCRDQYAEPAIKAILSSAKTGEVGDGKIFVSEVENAIRIRTGEEGGEALYLKDE